MPSYLQREDLLERHSKLFKERLSERLFVTYGSLDEGWRVYSEVPGGFIPHHVVPELPEGVVPAHKAAPRPESKGESVRFSKMVGETMTSEAKQMVKDVGGKTKPPKDCEYFKDGWCRIDGKPCPFDTETYQECPKLKDAARHPEDQIVLVF